MHKHPFGFLLGVAALLASSTAMAAIYQKPPAAMKVERGEAEQPCDMGDMGIPDWREEQVIDEVTIQESPLCSPDNPYDIAAFVKGTNNVSMATLMETHLAADAVIKKDDHDGDGDPDHIVIKLEVTELNGRSPDFPGVVPTYDIAPGIQPGFWVFSPKTRGMATKSFASIEANPLLRAPSPTIRVEQGDTVWLVLENTHYFPHTIHLHGVDHPYVDGNGEGNDGVPQTSEDLVMPGESRTYEIAPRHAGTYIYHCHVQTHVHLTMGLIGLIIVEENRPNNWVQTLNVGGGHVRHPSVAVAEEYDQEYDLVYQAVDKELHDMIQSANDVRLVAKKMNQEYDLTDATEDYYLLNGRSFPYTLRESLIVVEPDQNIKLRLLNAQSEMNAIHTHGHKATITHYDGVGHNPEAQITRDTFDMAPAQRLDLKLSTVDDGFHNYGEGVWLFHDHREKGITTDGMNPGGNVSAIVYKSYLNENGMPKVQGVDITQYFTKAFQERKLPVWQDADEWGSLGEVSLLQAAEQPPMGAKPSASSSVKNLFIGLLLGVIAYLLFANRKRAEELAYQLIGYVKGLREGGK